jgi:enterochelin esterase family protein
MKPGAAPAPARGNEAFGEMLITDLIPAIDREFRTETRREARAIAGLSMGAGQAVAVGLANPERFAWVGSFSGGFRGGPPVMPKPAPKLFWIGCGRLDGAFARNEALHQELERAGVPHTWFPGDGAHEWQVWRKHLHAFAPLLFR